MEYCSRRNVVPRNIGCRSIYWNEKGKRSPSYTKIHNLKYFVFGGNDGTRPSLTLTVPSPS